jgi:hypothetical protein
LGRAASLDADLAKIDRRSGRVDDGHLTSSRRRSGLAVPRRADWLGGAAVLIVTLAATAYLLAGGTLVGQDSATQFYPWFGHLGEQLRRGEIPEWLPNQLAGAPFAADPQSGWTYLPAMLLFTLLPLSLAVAAFLAVHLAIAGLGAYGLARAVGMPAAAATVVAVAYQLTGPVYGRSACCPATTEVASWTPVALLGAALAIAATTSLGRLGGWTLAGLAISQGLAAWLGQGSYYLLLALAGFIAYRTLLAPPEPAPGLGKRLASAALHGLAVVAVGFGLAAAGVLPRLAYVARTNVAGGEYDGASAWAADVGGATPLSVFDRLLFPNLHYPGTAAVALALVALIVARGRYAAPYWALMAGAGVVLASPSTTPLHRLLYAVLPRFEELHRHWPERVSIVAFLAPALLAGAAVGALLDRPGRQRLDMRLAVAAPVVAVVALWAIGAGVPVGAFLAAGAIALLLAGLAWLPRWRLRTALAPAIVAVVAIDLLLATHTLAGAAPYGGFHRVDVDAYYAPTGAARYLAARTSREPARFVGYDPRLQAVQEGQTVLYRYQFADPATAALLVNNRATMLGLDDLQGYNPVQEQRFVELLTALNGHPQEYHDANVYPAGLDSPLLDLLNVRFVVVPADFPADLPGAGTLFTRFDTVYLDDEARVLENPAALPRAWLVHDVRQVSPGAALPLLATGAVDPLTTALLEVPPPALAQPADPAMESVVVVERHPDRLSLRVRAAAPALLILSEVYDPGWHATVDGERTSVLVADHLLRAVTVPAGDHLVELSYQAPGLRLGVAISAATAATLAAMGVVLRLAAPLRRRRRYLA